MKVTEHEMRGLLTGKCVPGNMKVNEELPAYLVRQFATLHEQVQQLAAENALASEIMTLASMFMLDATAEGLFDAVAASNNPVLIAAVSSLSGAVSATPELESTDAWLNETNAKAVAAHAAFLWRRANEIVEEGGDKALVISVRTAAKLADEHAAQLSAGEVSNG